MKNSEYSFLPEQESQPYSYTIVLGHYHRSVIIRYMGKLIIALPSFQYASKPLRNERGMIMMRNNELKIVSVMPSDRKVLIEYWRTAIRA